MAFVIADRVQETSTSTGSGTIVLAGAVTGYQSFAAIGNTNNTYYTIADQAGTNWEVGIGTYYSGNVSLTRDTILASSNSNAAVTFGTGIKAVFVTYPAERAIFANSSNITTITNFVSSNVLITGGTISGANFTGLGTMSTQNANAIAVTGGTLNNVVIGGTTANLATFTNVNATRYVATANIAGNNSSGPYTYGTLGYSDVNIFASYTANANTYAQVITQNTSNGSAASVDYVVSNNLGNATAFYGNFGMNSANFAGTNSLNAPNTVYLLSSSSDVAIGTTSANAIHFVVNSNANDAFTINANGAWAANTSYGTANQVLTSQGVNLPPVWANVASSGGGSTGIGNSSILALNVNITANATINAGVNGFSVGPVNTANGVVVTITSGSRWVII
jgi:hypothetical protein